MKKGTTARRVSRSRLPTRRMTAVVKTKPVAGPAGTEVKSVPVPRPGDGEVLIRVLATAVCGSDRHIYKWDESMASIVKPPRIYGHEFCGEIVSFGPAAARQDLREGQYVSAEMHVTCGHCRPCRTGQRHICENTRILGVHGDGCFAQYVVVPAYNVSRWTATWSRRRWAPFSTRSGTRCTRRRSPTSPASRSRSSVTARSARCAPRSRASRAPPGSRSPTSTPRPRRTRGAGRGSGVFPTFR